VSRARERSSKPINCPIRAAVSPASLRLPTFPPRPDKHGCTSTGALYSSVRESTRYLFVGLAVAFKPHQDERSYLLSLSPRDCPRLQTIRQPSSLNATIATVLFSRSPVFQHSKLKGSITSPTTEQGQGVAS